MGLASDALGATIKLKFYGTKIRLLGCTNGNRSNKIEVDIDGNKEYYSQLGETVYKSLDYEKVGLTSGLHTVIITVKNPGKFVLDAIDIDESGTLLSENEDTAQSITLDKTAIDLLEGSTDKLTATVLPENAVNKKVVWSSSDETIATVDQEGNVSAIKVGQADITAKADGTNLSASCKVIVAEKELEPQLTPGKAILSISLVDGKLKITT